MIYKILLLILIIFLSIIFKFFLKKIFIKKNYKYTEEFLNKKIIEHLGEEEEEEEQKCNCKNQVSNNTSMTLANINSQYQQLSNKFNNLEEDVHTNNVQLEELNDQISHAKRVKSETIDMKHFKK